MTLKPSILADSGLRSFVSMDQAGEALGLSRDTIRRLIRSGDLEAVKIGRSVRIPVDAVNQLLDSSQMAAVMSK